MQRCSIFHQTLAVRLESPACYILHHHAPHDIPLQHCSADVCFSLCFWWIWKRTDALPSFYLSAPTVCFFLQGLGLQSVAFFRLQHLQRKAYFLGCIHTWLIWRRCFKNLKRFPQKNPLICGKCEHSSKKQERRGSLRVCMEDIINRSKISDRPVHSGRFYSVISNNIIRFVSESDPVMHRL